MTLNRNIGLTLTGKADAQNIQQQLTGILDLIQKTSVASARISSPLNQSGTPFNVDFNRLRQQVALFSQQSIQTGADTAGLTLKIKELGNLGGAIQGIRNLSITLGENQSALTKTITKLNAAKAEAASFADTLDAAAAKAQESGTLVTGLGSQRGPNGRFLPAPSPEAAAQAASELTAALDPKLSLDKLINLQSTASPLARGRIGDLVNLTALRNDIQVQGDRLGRAFMTSLEDGALSNPIDPARFDLFRRQSPQGYQQALQAGLGSDINSPNGFSSQRLAEQLQQPGAGFNLSRNAATGISTATASFYDAEGALQKLKIQYLDTGAVINRTTETIAGDFRILGDNSRATGSINALTGSLNELIAAEQRVGRAELSAQINNLSPTSDRSKIPANTPYISGASTEVDTLNNALRTNYEVSILDEQGVSHLLSTFTKFRNLDAATQGIQTFSREFQDATAKVEIARAKLSEALNFRETQTPFGALTTQLAEYENELTRLQEIQNNKGTIDPTSLQPIEQAITAQQKLVDETKVQLETDTQIVAVNQQIAAERQNATVAESEYTAELTKQRALLDSQIATARLAPNATIQSLARNPAQGGSPEALQRLGQIGLAVNNPEALAQQLSSSGAYLNIEKDLVKQVTSVSGAFRDQEGILKRFQLEFNNAGTVVTRFGGQMSGLQNALRQTGRDLVKVLEFTVATGAVFGGIAAITSSIRSIAELDQQLQRLSITSQASSTEIKTFFTELTSVALNTATPLKELVASADDIALATKKANQTTQEWRQSFLDLANAVGILTNISGLNTTDATDKLTAIMKQLDLQASDLIGVLSKITAVAGGQSGAVADITTGLGAMAEAAKQANLTIDQSVAVLQVLSQVTSKSSAEVAVSFKNLTGSLGSPGAIKVLDQYGIAVKDAQGNLRNIIDIYSEISDKIKSGAIAAGDVQAVLRGLSGGPRRLPDAAALLANIGSINQVTAQSVGATNEALIANAKILDTIPAKVTQLQTAFDAFIQSNFGDAFKSLVGSFVDDVKKLFDLLAHFPPGFYTGLLTIIPALLLVRGGTAAWGGILRSLGVSTSQVVTPTEQLTVATNQLRESFIAALPAAQQESLGLQEVAASAEKAANSTLLSSKRISSLKSGALFGGIAGATTLATGGSPLSAIENAGLTGGIGIAAAGAPEIGLPIAGISLLLQTFIKDNQNLDAAQRASTQDILQSIQTYQQATSSLQNLNVQQSTNLDLLTQYSKSGDINQILSGVQQYGATAKQIIDANTQISDSFEALLKQLPDIQKRFGSTVLAARNGAFNSGQLKSLSVTLADQIAQEVYPDYTSLAQIGATHVSAPGTQNFGAVSGQADKQKQSALQQAQADYEQQLTTLNLQVDKNLNPIEYSSRLHSITDGYNAMTAAIEQNSKTVQSNTLDYAKQAQQFTEFQKVLLLTKQYTGQITPEDFTTGTQNVNQYQAVSQQILATGAQALQSGNIGKAVSGLFRSRALSDALNSAFLDSNGDITPGTIPLEKVKPILEAMGQLNELRAKGVPINDLVIAQLAKELGYNVELTKSAQQLLDAQELQKGQAEQLAAIYTQNADLLGKVVTSTQPSNTFSDQVAQVDSLKEHVDTLNNFLVASSSNLDQYRSAFSGTIGLESLSQTGVDSNGDQQYVVTADKIGQVIQQNIVRFNLIGQAASNYTQDLITQGKAYDALNAAKQHTVTTSTDVSDAEKLRLTATYLNNVTAAQKAFDDSVNKTNSDLLSSALAHPDSVFAKDVYIGFERTLGGVGDAAVEAFKKMTPDQQTQAVTTFLDRVSSGAIDLSKAEYILAAAADKATAQLKEQQQALSDLASASSSDYSKLLSGGYNQNPSQYKVDAARAQAIASNRPQLNDALGGLSDTQLKSLEKQLSTLHGLEDATNLTAPELTDRLATLFANYGLTAGQIDVFTQSLIHSATVVQSQVIPSLDELGTKFQSNQLNPKTEQGKLDLSFLGPIATQPGSLESQDYYRQYLRDSGGDQAVANFDKLLPKDKTSAVLKFYQDWANGIVNVTDKEGKLATAEAQAANERTINANAQKTIQDLIAQKNKIENDIKGLQAQEGNVTVRPGDQGKQATKDRQILNKNSDIEAQIAADEKTLAQTNALITATGKLRTGLDALNKSANPAAINNFQTALARIPGLESLATVDSKDLFGALVQIAQQFGLTGTQALEFYAKVEALRLELQRIDGLKAQIEIDVQLVTSQKQAATTQLQSGQYAGSDETRLLQNSRGNGSAQTKTTTDQNTLAQAQNDALNIGKQIGKDINKGIGSAFGQTAPTVGGSAGPAAAAKNPLQYSIEELSDTIKKSEKLGYSTQKGDVNALQANIDKITSQLTPQQRKDLENQRVQLFNGTQLIGTFKTSSEILSKAMSALTDVEQARLNFDTQADQIRRIRIGSGTFAAIANVPTNAQNGISVGGPNGPITVNLNIQGTILSPAAAARIGDIIASQIKSSAAASK